MIIAVRAILVGFVVFGHVFTECLRAFLAQEHHFCGLAQPVVLIFSVTFCAVVPLLAARCTNGYLCVQDMFARSIRVSQFVNGNSYDMNSVYAGKNQLVRT